MRRELLRELIEQSVSPCGVHAALRVPGRGSPLGRSELKAVVDPVVGALARWRLLLNRRHVAEEPCAERSLRRLRAVTAALRDHLYGVLLLEREPGWQCSEPRAGAAE